MVVKHAGWFENGRLTAGNLLDLGGLGWGQVKGLSLLGNHHLDRFSVGVLIVLELLSAL